MKANVTSGDMKIFVGVCFFKVISKISLTPKTKPPYMDSEILKTKTRTLALEEIMLSLSVVSFGGISIARFKENIF